MSAIYKREMRAYFSGPIGYIFVAVFLALTAGIFSLSTLMQGRQSSLSLFFTGTLFIYSIIVPLLTMKSFSEEKKSKTEQLILTSPVSLTGMVFGKFLSAYTLYGASLLVSCLNYYTLFKFGDPNAAVLFNYTIGMLLIGLVYVAIGIFVSSITENQLIAAIGTIGILIVLLVISFLNQFIDNTAIRVILNFISIYARFAGSFTSGIFDISAVLYFISIAFVFLFITIRVYEKRRWA